MKFCFDDDDEFVDMLDDDEEEEIVDVEQPMDSVESENTEKSIEDNSLITPSTTDMQSTLLSSTVLEDNESISDDEDSQNSCTVLPSSIDNDIKMIFQVLHQTHGVRIKSRKLIKIMRSIAIIDNYVRRHQSGPKNGFIIDTQVSSIFLQSTLKRILACNSHEI